MARFSSVKLTTALIDALEIYELPAHSPVLQLAMSNIFIIALIFNVLLAIAVIAFWWWPRIVEERETKAYLAALMHCCVCQGLITSNQSFVMGKNERAHSSCVGLEEDNALTMDDCYDPPVPIVSWSDWATRDFIA